MPLLAFTLQLCEICCLGEFNVIIGNTFDGQKLWEWSPSCNKLKLSFKASGTYLMAPIPHWKKLIEKMCFWALGVGVGMNQTASLRERKRPDVSSILIDCITKPSIYIGKGTTNHSTLCSHPHKTHTNLPIEPPQVLWPDWSVSAGYIYSLNKC